MLTLSDIPSALLIYTGEFLTDDYYIAENVDDDDDKSVYGENFDPCDRVALAALLHNYDMLEYFLTRYPNHKNLISVSLAYSGNLKALQWAVTEMHCPLDDTRIFYNAVCGGNLAMLRWLKQQGCPLDEYSMKCAARNGNLQVMKWLYSQGAPWNHNGIPIEKDEEAIEGDLIDWYRFFACPLDEEIWEYAVFGGSIPMLQWLYDHDIPWDKDAFTVAAARGNMTVLLWLYSNCCPWSYEQCIITATREGHLSILQWLYQKSSSEALESYDRFEKSIVTWQKSMSFSCLWNETLWIEAVSNGNLDILQWLYEQDIPCDENACSTAARIGNMDILQWLHAHGCPWDESSSDWAIVNNNVNMLHWLYSMGCPWSEEYCNKGPLCQTAVDDNNLDILQWLFSLGQPWNQWTCKVAAGSPNPDIQQWLLTKGCPDSMLTWLHTQDCPWDERMFNTIAKSGDLDFLQWTYSLGCTDWDSESHCAAAKSGNLQMLQWLHQIGCPSYYDVNLANGMYEISKQRYDNLEWFRDLACPWDEKLWEAAAESGNIDMLQWLYDLDIPWDEMAVKSAARNGSIDALLWLHKHGCPWNRDTLYVSNIIENVEILKWFMARNVSRAKAKSFVGK